MIAFLLFLFACNNKNLCEAGVQQIAGPGKWSGKVECGPYATATIQTVDDRLFAVCTCPCIEETPE